MKVFGKDDQLFLTFGKPYEVLSMRLVESIDPYIEYLIVDDIGTLCWHKSSSLFTLEEFRDMRLNDILI